MLGHMPDNKLSIRSIREKLAQNPPDTRRHQELKMLSEWKLARRERRFKVIGVLISIALTRLSQLERIFGLRGGEFLLLSTAALEKQAR